ncbi:MAG: TrkH family potassium uptake protein [Spirochaetota bacterium]
MEFKTRDRISGYFDLFFIFIEVDIFIWVLFEISFPFRPMVYTVSRVIAGTLIIAPVVQFLLDPHIRSHIRRYWRHYLIASIFLYCFYLFQKTPLNHRFLFIYSRLLLALIEILLFIKFVLQLSRLREIFGYFRVSPAQLIIVSFASIILIGSFILYLPYAHSKGTSIRYIDALFTATSSVCVTGLVVVDTGTAFSRLGHIFILMLIQAGGLGIMTIAAFIQLSLGSQLSVYGRFSTASFIGQTDLRNLFTVIRAIVMITFLFELTGTLLFLPFFLRRMMGSFEALFYSIFHSVSAFCNAGFSLYSNSFMHAVGNLLCNLVLMWLIVSGGLGFTVILNIGRRLLKGRKERITVQTMIVLISSLSLITLGALGFFLFERGYMLRGLKPHEKFLASLFQSITTRTAGFNTVDIGSLRHVTLFMMSTLMFIGASPGSTGGGIKTTTFFILILSIITILRDQRFNTIFNRRIPFQVVNRAFAILVSSLCLIVAGTFLLSLTERFSLIQIFFEIVSAFGTVGLSTGITPMLSDFGKILIMLFMFVGRLGPLTIVLAVRTMQVTKLITYPEERIMVG